MTKEVELVYDAKAALGEGPFWDEEKEKLFWVDILGKKVHIYNPKTDSHQSIEVEQYVGAVVLDRSGNLILAMQHGLYVLDGQTKDMKQLEDPEAHFLNNRFNDGKCDPAGRFWAGTMDLNEEEGKGSLYVMDHDYKVRKVLSQLTISNGLAWSPDHTVMYFIDTPTRKVTAFDYNLYSGAISQGRTVISIPEGEGGPDGMTIDSEGMLWIAHWGGYKVSRWNPNSGKQLTEIHIPAKQVTSCAFGGHNLEELYITTARHGLSTDELEAYPLSGGLFKVKTGIKGTPSYKFGSGN